MPESLPVVLVLKTKSFIAPMCEPELLDLSPGEFKVAGRERLELISVFEKCGLVVVREEGGLVVVREEG